jgi:hypothetical protein
VSTNKAIALCVLVQMAALIVVGLVSDGLARHVLQTSPSWIVAALALHESSRAKWAALPVFVFWLAIMSLIWLYLLGIAHIITGNFGNTEVAMTLVVMATSVLGIFAALSARSDVAWWRAAIIIVAVAAVQVGAMALSLRPPISSDTLLVNWLRAP